MRRVRRKLVIITIALAIVVCAPYAFYRYHWPYGYSHCCDLAVSQDLHAYADEHDLWFPHGEATPEASLSLLYRHKPTHTTAYNLRGKTVPEAIVVERLARGELLTPETCGWHYVEGLRLDDHPDLALFWDKAGLDHNGGRLRKGGHVVYFVSGTRTTITGEEWPAFLEKQQALLTKRERGEEDRADIDVELRGKKMHVQLREVGEYIYGRAWSTAGGTFELLASVDAAVGGRPVIKQGEIRKAKTVVENGRVRFMRDRREIVFDGDKFEVK